MPDNASTDQTLSKAEQIAALRGRIARFLLGIGVTEIVVCSVLIWAFLRLHNTSVADLTATLSQDLRQSVAVQLGVLQKWAMPAAALLTTLGLVPAVGYLVLAQAIRRGRHTAVLLVQMLLMLQIIMLSGEVAISLYHAVATGSPGYFSMRVVFIGTVVVVLIFVLQLAADLRQREATLVSQDQDPTRD